MQKTFIQILLIVVFVLMAASSASTSSTGSSSYRSSYTPSSSYSKSSTSTGSSSNTQMQIKKTDFPDPPCETCKGRKGWYVFDVWYTCTRCGGSGKEPKH